MGSLFSKVDGIEPGQVWIDVELYSHINPHPMSKIRVVEIDNVGMVVIESAAFGSTQNDKVVTPAALRTKYRLEQKER